MDDLKILLQEIPLDRLLAVQKVQYMHRIPLIGSVAANSTFDDKIEISSAFHFVCLGITGGYTTLSAGPADSGICNLSMTLRQVGDTKEFFDQLIPLDLILTPGRRKSSLVPGAAASAVMSAPMLPFVAFLRAGSTIQVGFSNAGDYANSYALCFHGIRIANR